jgi:hypothetical protein
MTMAVFGPNETPSAVHHRLMMLVDTRMHGLFKVNMQCNVIS